MDLLEQFKREWSELDDLPRFLFVFLGVQLVLCNQQLGKCMRATERLTWQTR